ncbi:UPF0280 family protein [Porphyromonadaceae bacterium OttesenSCG-928-L07]|nr:UPF0280 family protein [Porphyromonadaceae bacterium OttesenSCG-928-L07]MDL2251968.1 UPF0280 family protein [Odoribacter sp. OttesenSCG-928-J03]
MEYKDRVYRDYLSNDRWTSFIIKYRGADIWIGVDKDSYQADMPEFCNTVFRDLKISVEEYFKRDPSFATSLVPYEAQEFAPEILKKMSAVSYKTGIGPMSAVAGAVALYILEALKSRYNIVEGIVENGGDIYADIKEDIDVPVFAGGSPLSEKVGLHIQASEAPLGICTSSGTVGHSLSFGKADAVMIICHDVLLADSYATNFANYIRKAEDINKMLDKIKQIDDILAALLIKDDQMGVIGKFELKLFQHGDSTSE